MKNKNLIIVISILIIVIALGAYAAWWYLAQPALKVSPQGAGKTTVGTTTPTGALPSITPATNPVQKMPDLNPVNKANPFYGLYKNPFQ